MEAYLEDVVVLPHSSADDARFAIASRKRGELPRKQNAGSDASDADIWIIASALEHDLPLLSHDKQQVALGRSLRLAVWTNLPGLRDDNPKNPLIHLAVDLRQRLTVALPERAVDEAVFGCCDGAAGVRQIWVC